MEAKLLQLEPVFQFPIEIQMRTQPPVLNALFHHPRRRAPKSTRCNKSASATTKSLCPHHRSEWKFGSAMGVRSSSRHRLSLHQLSNSSLKGAIKVDLQHVASLQPRRRPHNSLVRARCRSEKTGTPVSLKSMTGAAATLTEETLAIDAELFQLNSQD